MNQGIIIPVYNHGKTVAGVVEKLMPFHIPVILIDDGSNEETKQQLAAVIAQFPGTDLVTLEKNSGKGSAIIAGIDRAKQLGLTHVLQIDADGQHDVQCAGLFLEKCAQNPDVMICSYPEYDDSVPASRKNGRKFANAMTHIETWSHDIADSMCGFRMYPVDAVHRLVHRYYFDRRMGFDIEILIRLSWIGIPFAFYPVHVVYPEDGISHFHLVRDNVRITWVFVRLFFGMLIRIPLFVYRRIRRNIKTEKGGL